MSKIETFLKWFVFVALALFVSYVITFNMSKLHREISEREAVRNGAGYYEANENGAPKFVWKTKLNKEDEVKPRN